MKIEQPYKSFNLVQRAAVRFGMSKEFHEFMTRHCHTKIDDLDFLCFRFMRAAYNYYIFGGQSKVLNKALKSFLLTY